MKIGIYKIVNPSNKVYIGKSSNIEKRFDNYRVINCKNQYKLYNSLKKYGWENHTFEIIEECEIEYLNCRERYWQDFYDVLNGGLNLLLQECNDLQQVVSEETKQKISNTLKGRVYTESHRSNIGNGNRGKKRTKETKKKMSDSKKGKKRCIECHSLSESHKNKIRESLKGTPHAEERISKIKSSCKTSKRVVNIETLEEYNSIRELSIIENITYSTLLYKIKNIDKNNTPYRLIQ